MAKMKDMLIGTIENLAKETGYDFEDLMELFFTALDEADDDEPFDQFMEDFAEITRERDW